MGSFGAKGINFWAIQIMNSWTFCQMGLKRCKVVTHNCICPAFWYRPFDLNFRTNIAAIIDVGLADFTSAFHHSIVTTQSSPTQFISNISALFHTKTFIPGDSLQIH